MALLKLIRTGRQASIYGSVTLFPGVIPAYVKYHGVWPRIRVIFTQEREAVSKTLTVRNKQFSAGVAAKALGLPETLSAADNEGACSRISEFEFLFDFSVQPVSEQDIQMQAMTLLFEFAKLREQFSNEHGQSLEDVMGVHVVWTDPEGEEEEAEPEPEPKAQNGSTDAESVSRRRTNFQLVLGHIVDNLRSVGVPANQIAEWLTVALNTYDGGEVTLNQVLGRRQVLSAEETGGDEVRVPPRSRREHLLTPEVLEQAREQALRLEGEVHYLSLLVSHCVGERSNEKAVQRLGRFDFLSLQSGFTVLVDLLAGKLPDDGIIDVTPEGNAVQRGNVAATARELAALLNKQGIKLSWVFHLNYHERREGEDVPVFNACFMNDPVTELQYEYTMSRLGVLRAFKTMERLRWTPEADRLLVDLILEEGNEQEVAYLLSKRTGYFVTVGAVRGRFYNTLLKSNKATLAARLRPEQLDAIIFRLLGKGRTEPLAEDTEPATVIMTLTPRLKAHLATIESALSPPQYKLYEGILRAGPVTLKQLQVCGWGNVVNMSLHQMARTLPHLIQEGLVRQIGEHVVHATYWDEHGTTESPLDSWSDED